MYNLSLMEPIRSGLRQIMADFLKTQPETEYIDVCSDMLGQDRKPIRALFVSDQIHLSPAGYQILRKEIGEFLSQDCPRSRATVSPRRIRINEVHMSGVGR